MLYFALISFPSILILGTSSRPLHFRMWLSDQEKPDSYQVPLLNVTTNQPFVTVALLKPNNPWLCSLLQSPLPLYPLLKQPQFSRFLDSNALVVSNGPPASSPPIPLSFPHNALPETFPKAAVGSAFRSHFKLKVDESAVCASRTQNLTEPYIHGF